MSYLEETADLFDAFEESCLCKEISDHERDRMRSNEELLRPAMRLQYLQTSMLLSIAQALEVIAAKPPH